MLPPASNMSNMCMLYCETDVIGTMIQREMIFLVASSSSLAIVLLCCVDGCCRELGKFQLVYALAWHSTAVYAAHIRVVCVHCTSVPTLHLTALHDGCTMANNKFMKYFSYIRLKIDINTFELESNKKISNSMTNSSTYNTAHVPTNMKVAGAESFSGDWKKNAAAAIS